MVTIIDYGVGNLASVRNAFLKLGYAAQISNNADEIRRADKVVLPGVGAFADGMNSLRQQGLDKPVQEAVDNGTPFLGICLGLQLLFSRSEEHGSYEGLDIIQGRVAKFELPREYKVPHMGWNQIHPKKDSRLFDGIPSGSHCYFVHSYYVIPDDDSVSAAHSDYGIDFVCAVEKDNMFATQFHPEKSGDIGLQVLKNFADL